MWESVIFVYSARPLLSDGKKMKIWIKMISLPICRGTNLFLIKNRLSHIKQCYVICIKAIYLNNDQNFLEFNNLL